MSISEGMDEVWSSKRSDHSSDQIRSTDLYRCDYSVFGRRLANDVMTGDGETVNGVITRERYLKRSIGKKRRSSADFVPRVREEGES